MVDAMQMPAAEYAAARRNITAGKAPETEAARMKPAFQLSTASYQAARREITRGRIPTLHATTQDTHQ